MKKHNFPYSDDNKRYYTWNYYLKKKYKNKIFKVPLNANFGCPNRDGKKGFGGCTFCSNLGSGDCAGNSKDSLLAQFEKQKLMMLNKWPTGLPMAYFQAFTNTYAPLQTLKETFQPFIENSEIKAICIATRADCLEQDKIDYLNSLTKHKEIWLEIGLQTIHDTTANFINRGHTYEEFYQTILSLAATNLKICVHLMNSLPYETKEMMLETAKQVAKLPIHAVKIHMLHILKNTKMAYDFQNKPFPILTLEEYVDIVVSQLEILPSHFIIQRLTGDAIKEDLIAPLWTLKKVIVLNEIDKRMKLLDTWQGKFFQP